ncbi:hypothetical protein DIPPA_30482 [Diplonema papillatum]|nr:hypothetical protein DIPPA_30482 [Diplonema papillatum]
MGCCASSDAPPKDAKRNVPQKTTAAARAQQQSVPDTKKPDAPKKQVVESRPAAKPEPVNGKPVGDVSPNAGKQSPSVTPLPGTPKPDKPSDANGAPKEEKLEDLLALVQLQIQERDELQKQMDE